MEKTTLYLPAPLQAGLRALARRTGRAQADLIREALATYVSAQERPRPRSIGAGEDAGLPARDSEAWLRTQWDQPTAGPSTSARSGRTRSTG